MVDMIFDGVLFNILGGLSAFFIIFDVTIHFGLETNELDYGNAGCFIFKLTNNLFIGLIMIWGVFWVIAIVEFVFAVPKVMVYVLSFYLISKRSVSVNSSLALSPYLFLM